MALRTRTVLKSYFETGDKPTQAQFGDFIDSVPNISDDGVFVEHFKGTYASESALTTAHPTASDGDYAYISTVGTDAIIWLWDDDDSAWVEGGTAGTLTPDATTSIKGKSELIEDAELDSATPTDNSATTPTESAITLGIRQLYRLWKKIFTVFYTKVEADGRYDKIEYHVELNADQLIDTVVGNILFKNISAGVVNLTCSGITINGSGSNFPIPAGKYCYLRRNPTDATKYIATLADTTLSGGGSFTASSQAQAEAAASNTAVNTPTTLETTTGITPNRLWYFWQAAKIVLSNIYMLMANTTKATFDGTNVALGYPEIIYDNYSVTSNMSIMVTPTTKLGAGAILFLVADGIHTINVVGATLDDASSFTNTSNYVNPIIFYNRGDRIVYSFKTAYSVVPTFITSPANQTVIDGTSVTFTTATTGAPTITYQWQVNAGAGYSNISGATSASYTFTAVVADNGKSYRCVATNAYGSTTSTAASLTVGAAGSAVAITVNPVSQSINNGSNVTFSITATGTATITYQWQKNIGGGFNPVSGATSSSYTFAVAPGDQGAQYRCVATNAYGSAVSTAATLTVIIAAPTMTFTMSKDRTQIAAIANKQMSVAPSFAGITVSGHTVTGIAIDANNNAQYNIQLDSAHAFNSTPTITVPGSLWTSNDTGIYGGVTAGAVDLFFVRNSFVTESSAFNFSSTGGTFAAYAVSKIPIYGDFSIQIDLGTSGVLGRGAIIGFNTSPLLQDYTGLEFWGIVQNTGTNNFNAGTNGTTGLDSTPEPFTFATDSLFRIKRVGTAVSTEVFRSGSWVNCWTFAGTSTGPVYPGFVLYGSAAANNIQNLLIS